MSLSSNEARLRAQERRSTELAAHILIITHKFLEPPVERNAKAEIMPCLFNATWLITVAHKNVPKDMGNDKAHIEELAADADTNFRGLKQDIKQLDDDMRASFLQIGDAFSLNANNIEVVKQDVASIKTTMATKEDLSKLEARFDKLEATQAEILALLKQKPDK